MFLFLALESNFELSIEISEPNKPRIWLEKDVENNTIAALLISHPNLKIDQPNVPP